MNNIVKWLTYTNFPKYLFSSYGDIKNINTGKLVIGSSTNGYHRVNLKNKDNIKCQNL